MTGAEAIARWRARNPERDRAQRISRRIAVRQWIADYKAKRGCKRCHIKDPRVLDLHHDKGAKKVMAVSQMIARRGKAAVLSELMKCHVLCANCHRIEHVEQMTTGVFFRAS